MQKNYIAVASQSEQKVQPTKEAFLHSFPHSENIISGFSTLSGINEQPIWYEETRQWAWNRLQNLKKITTADYYVSIENGIIPIDNKRYDVWHIIIESTKWDIIEILTKKVEFPTKAVEIAKKIWFDITTVWKALHELDNTIDHADPHTKLTNWVYSRKQLIYDALTKGLWQINNW